MSVLSNFPSNNQDSEIFVAIYGETSNAEIVAANMSGKVCFCKYGDLIAPMVSKTQSIRSVFCQAEGNSITQFECTGKSWKKTTRKCMPSTKTITLAASGWNSANNQGIVVSGVLADETKQIITVTPKLNFQTAYYDAGIRCTGQAADSLLFTAKNIPTADLNVYVIIQEVSS